MDFLTLWTKGHKRFGAVALPVRLKIWNIATLFVHLQTINRTGKHGTTEKPRRQTKNLADKRKTARAWFFVLLPFAILLALFAFRSRITEFGSRQMLRSRDKTEARQLADSIQQWFNYTKNDSAYQYTFLEFGAKGCIACKKMEQVTRDIKDKYPREVNVRLVNVTEAKGQQLTKHFGIVTIPAQIILDRRGKETFRHAGYIPAEELEERFK